MKQQLLYYFGALIYLLSLPLLIYQGRRLKKRFPRLPAASNPKGRVAGSGEKISVIGIGESTMAGLGVQDHKDGLAGKFASEWHSQFGDSVDWQVFAKAGYTAKDVHQRLLPKLPEAAPDVVLIALAANDIFALHSPLRWRRDMEDLLIGLSALWPEAKLVLLNLPPVENFPGLTALMRSIFGHLINLYHPVNLKLADIFEHLHYCENRINLADWKKLVEGAEKIEDFFSDGVHPNGRTYAAWAKETVAEVAEQRWFVS